LARPARQSVIHFTPRIARPTPQGLIQIAPQIFVPDVLAGGSNNSPSNNDSRVLVNDETQDLDDNITG